VQAYLTCSAAAAVDFVGTAGPREGLLMAPTYAVPDMLDRMGITLQDFDLYEIHEAFAAQVLCTLKAWESEEYCRTRLGRKAALGPIDRAKLNLKGSSLAAGHPFAATGHGSWRRSRNSSPSAVLAAASFPSALPADGRDRDS